MGKGLIMRAGGGIDLSPVTAGANDVLSGKVIVDKDGNPIAGRIQKQGAMTFNAGTTQKTIAVSGKYMTGNITIPGVPLPPANIIKKNEVYTGAGGSKVTGTASYYLKTDEIIISTSRSYSASYTESLFFDPTCFDEATYPLTGRIDIETNNSDGELFFIELSNRDGLYKKQYVFVAPFPFDTYSIYVKDSAAQDYMNIYRFSVYRESYGDEPLSVGLYFAYMTQGSSIQDFTITVKRILKTVC